MAINPSNLGSIGEVVGDKVVILVEDSRSETSSWFGSAIAKDKVKEVGKGSLSA